MKGRSGGLSLRSCSFNYGATAPKVYFFFEFPLVGTTRGNRKSRKKFDKTRWSNASDRRPHEGMASPRVNTKFIFFFYKYFKEKEQEINLGGKGVDKLIKLKVYSPFLYNIIGGPPSLAAHRAP